MVLNSGYRSPLTFNDEVIGQADKGLERLRSALKPAQPGASNASDELKKTLADQVKKTRDAFIEIDG